MPVLAQNQSADVAVVPVPAFILRVAVERVIRDETFGEVGRFVLNEFSESRCRRDRVRGVCNRILTVPP